MSTQMLRVAAAMMLVAAIVGCGGGQKPAEVQKPAEPAFVAQVIPMDSMLVASVAKMGPYADAGKAVAELVGWLKTAKVTPVSGPFGMYMDDPTKVKPESTRYEICIPVPPGTKADKKAGIVVKMLPPMQLAWTEYTGPYDKVGPVYAKLYGWIAENKYEAAGPMIEWYISDPAKVPAESLQTRVGVVAKPAAPPADTAKTAEEPKKEEGKPERTGR